MSEPTNPFEQPKSEPISTSLPPVPEVSESSAKWGQNTAPQETPYQQPYQQQTFGMDPSALAQQPPYAESVSSNVMLPVSGMGIAALVCGVLALFGSWIPIINFGSVILGIVAVVLGICGIRSVSKGKTRGKGWGISGTIVGAVAIVISIVVAVLFFIGIKEIANDPEFRQEMEEMRDLDLSDPDAIDRLLDDSDDIPLAENLAIGKSATTDDGLTVTVTAVEPIIDEYEGDLLKVTVSYENTGREREDFDSYDWGSINGSGVYTGIKYASGAIENELQSGALTPGSKTSGVVLVAGDAATITYDGDFDEAPEISWKVK